MEKTVLPSLPSSSRRLDWIVALLSIWFIIGVYTDGWAHNHIPELETFFTPWHGLLYSGFLLTALTVGVAWWRNYRKGYGWSKALPLGYNAALLGAIIFIVGGVGDLTWHEIFGIEAGVDALLSPTHLVLAVGGALLVSGPLRSFLLQNKPVQNSITELPGIISLTATISVVMFMTQYVHPVTHPWLALSKQTSDPFFGQALGMSNVIVQMAILMGFILYTIKRHLWPVGTFTIIFVLTTTALSFMKDQYYFIGAAAVAGIVVDIFSAVCFKKFHRSGVRRVYSALVPAVLTASYIIASILHEPTWWSPHLLGGAVATAAIVGWLMSYAVFDI